MNDFPYYYEMSKADHSKLSTFLGSLRQDIGDNFNLTTHTTSWTSRVEIKTDSPHIAFFMLLLRLGVDV